MTNFEKIKNMSVEEFSYIMSSAITDCFLCPICEYCKMHDNNDNDSHKFDTCSGTWEQWLKS